jgi:hypothetical protein
VEQTPASELFISQESVICTSRVKVCQKAENIENADLYQCGICSKQFRRACDLK